MCIPGRRVAFADGHTWEYAVVMTPQPGRGARGDRGRARRRGGAAGALPRRTSRRRGRPSSPASPGPSSAAGPPRTGATRCTSPGRAGSGRFAVIDRLAGRHEADAYTMPVIGVREAWTFGGAPQGKAHPWVVDVLLPSGMEPGEGAGLVRREDRGVRAGAVRLRLGRGPAAGRGHRRSPSSTTAGSRPVGGGRLGRRGLDARRDQGRGRDADRKGARAGRHTGGRRSSSAR